jgi:hypothetical protein
MFDALSFAEIDGQRVELLPARTVLSMFVADGGSVCPASSQSGGLAGFGGNGTGSLLSLLGIPISLGGGTGNPGSSNAYAAC